MKTNISLRHIFQAPKGYTWVSADYSAMESYIAAACSQDEVLANIYRLQHKYETGEIPKPIDPNGKEYEDPKCDSHIVAASNFHPDLKKLYEETPWLCNKSHPLVKEFRPKGKTLNFRVIFLGSAEGIAQQLNISVEDSQDLLDKYFSYPNGFWKLKEWLDVNVEIIKRTRTSYTPMGRIINCFETNAKGLGDINTAARKGINAKIQGCGSDATKLAFVNLTLDKFESLNQKYKHLLKNNRKAEICNLSHDEINVIVPGFIKLDFISDKKDPDFKLPKTVLDKSRYSTSNIPNGCIGTELEEFEMALDYGTVVKQEMENSLNYIFEQKLNFELPSKVEVEWSQFWKH